MCAAQRLSSPHPAVRPPRRRRRPAGPVRRLGDAGPVPGGIRDEHLAVRTAARRLRRLAHGRGRDARPARAASAPASSSPTTSRSIADGGRRSTRVRLHASDGGIVDDLFIYRLADGRFLTVANAANHEQGPGVVPAQARGARRARSRTASTDYAMLAVPGPERPVAMVEPSGRRPALPLALPRCDATVAGVPALVARHRLHRRGRRRAADRHRARSPTSGTRCSTRAPSPSGLAARDTLRLEVGFHLYGNDIDETRNPIEAGLGWACKEEHGFIGADARARTRAPRARAQAGRLRDDGPGIARHGNPVRDRGVVTSGTMSPSLGVGIGMAYVRRARSPARRSRSTSVARCAGQVRPQPSTRRRP